MFIGNWVIRFQAILIYLPTIAAVVAEHTNLLGFSHRENDLILLLCLIVLAFNKPVASKMQERKQ
jgi:hypothetical protein